MKAMVFAAGLGTRLQPLTNKKPKALVKVAGKTLLEWTLLKLHNAEIKEVVINVHHFPDMVIDFVHQHAPAGMKVHISDERKQLLDTGGGLWNAAGFFGENEDILVYNVDILSNLDIKKLIAFHRHKASVVTPAVKDRNTNRKLLFAEDYRLVGWKNYATGEIRWSSQEIAHYKAYAYSGVHIVNTRIFSLWPKSGAFPLFPEYLRIAANHPVYGFVHTDTWLDAGKPEALEQAENLLKSEVIKI